MTQYPGAYTDPYAGQMSEPPRTSGVAITALVLSLIGLIPCVGLLTAVIGAVLGLIALLTIGSNPERKGKGMAATAIVIGVVLIGGQLFFGRMLYNFIYGFYALVMKGPDIALNTGFAGDIGGFKSKFTGAAATAPDSEAQAFVDQLRARYGEFVSCEFDKKSGKTSQPQRGQPSMTAPYLLKFSKNTVDANVELVFADQTTGQMVKKLGSITVLDAVNGDLTYPASAGSTAPTATQPSGGRRAGPGNGTTSSPAGGGQSR